VVVCSLTERGEHYLVPNIYSSAKYIARCVFLYNLNLSCSLCNLLIVYRMQFYCHGPLPLLRFLFTSVILHIYLLYAMSYCTVVFV